MSGFLLSISGILSEISFSIAFSCAMIASSWFTPEASPAGRGWPDPEDPHEPEEGTPLVSERSDIVPQRTTSLELVQFQRNWPFVVVDAKCGQTHAPGPGCCLPIKQTRHYLLRGSKLQRHRQCRVANFNSKLISNSSLHQQDSNDSHKPYSAYTLDLDTIASNK